MQLRKKLAILTSLALPLTGIAVFGGVTAATAGGGPLLTCTAVGEQAGGNGAAISFNSGSTGIYLNSASGKSAVLVANAFNGNTTISENLLVITGQTLTVAGFTGTYTVTGSSYPSALVPSPDVLSLDTPLVGNTAKGGETKAKGAVTINATDGSNNTTAFNGSVVENLDVTASGCTSSAAVPGEFSPTQANFDGTDSVSNSATGLLAPPNAMTGTYTFPTIGSGWEQPVATTGSWSNPKGDKTELGVGDGFGVVFGAGVISGDYASAKSGTLNLGVSGLTVCTVGELTAIATGLGPDAGTIAQNANPLSVCDGGTLNPHTTGSPPVEVSGAYGGNGLNEILAAETAPGGATTNGADGTQIGAIYGIQVQGLIGNQVI